MQVLLQQYIYEALDSQDSPVLIVASLLAYALSASKFREHQLGLHLLMLNSGKELSFEIATLSTTREQ